MPERLDRSYRRARRVARAGATAFYGLAALCLVTVLGYYLHALPQEPSVGRSLTALACAIVFAAPAVPVAEFLRRFGREGHSPFGKGQPARLLAAALLLLPRALLSAAVPLEEAVSTELAFPLTRAGLYLKIIWVTIFLVCLAMIVRYGDALKEDSDSFG